MAIGDVCVGPLIIIMISEGVPVPITVRVLVIRF